MADATAKGVDDIANILYVNVPGLNPGGAIGYAKYGLACLAAEIDGATGRCYINGTLVDRRTVETPVVGKIAVGVQKPGMQVVFTDLRIAELPR